VSSKYNGIDQRKASLTGRESGPTNPARGWKHRLRAFSCSCSSASWTTPNLDLLQTHHDSFLSPTMAASAFGTATAAIGLAATVFQKAKGIRDTIYRVSPSPLILSRPHRSLIAHAPGDV
jgi:hypothetical protein